MSAERLHVASEPEIPMFEGHPVATTKLKLTSTVAIDVDNVVLRQDDIVRVIVECRISGIQHNENARGDLERIQVAKTLSVHVIPWDDTDPTDTGVFRG